MLNIFGNDIFNIISLFLDNYKDLLSLKYVCKNTYYYNFTNKVITMDIPVNMNLESVKKIIYSNLVIFKIPDITICVLLDCTLCDVLNIDSVTALHIRDCYTYSNPLIFNRYDNLVAVYLYNFIIDPDDLILPNLEYLFIYESDYDDSYVYMFNIERYPKLKYLDLCRIYMDDDSSYVPFIEYYNGCFRNYNMPNLKYIEWHTKLLSEYEYLTLFPKLLAIITYDEPLEEFKNIKIIKPNESDIAKKYYNDYFLIK